MQTSVPRVRLNILDPDADCCQGESLGNWIAQLPQRAAG